MENLIAQDIRVGEITGPAGPLSNPGDQGGLLLANVLSAAIGILTIVAAIWFLFNIITGGIAIIGAGSDKAKVEGARTKITNGVVGLIVVFTAVMLVNFVTFLLGIEGPLAIAQWINLISP